MPDMNKMIKIAKDKTKSIERDVAKLLDNYENLYRDASRTYLRERASSDGEDLGDFYRLVNLIRRNRNVVGSMMRAMKNLRSIEGFEVVEQDVPDEVIEKDVADIVESV